MRKFYFENQLGERISLNNETGIFLYEPTGLGISFSHTYGDIGEDGFFRRNKFKTSQLGTNFTLFFDPNKKNPYVNYHELLSWISKATELYLVYLPTEELKSGGDKVKEFYRRINIQTLDKSELDIYGSLRIQSVVVPLSPWFLSEQFSASFDNKSAYAKRYNYQYTSDLRYGHYSMYPSVILDPQGHIPAAVKVTINGPITNPSIVLFGFETGKLYGECAVNTTLSDTEKLVLSTLAQDSYVKKITSGNQEFDLIDSVDITKNAFFTVPVTEQCEIQIRGTNYTGSASMTLYQFYRGV